MKPKLNKRRFLLMVSGGLALAGAPGAFQVLRDRFSAACPPSLSLPPRGIVVHHSATTPAMQPLTDAARINRMHRGRGLGAWYMGKTYHIAYHYVVLCNGTVQEGRPELCRGGHTSSYKHNRWIGICLVGYFDPKWKDPRYHQPSTEQMDALVSLSATLIKKYNMKIGNVLPHKKINKTQCPGRSFPMERYLERLKTACLKNTRVINAEVSNGYPVSNLRGFC